jgi:hypothetical protein
MVSDLVLLACKNDSQDLKILILQTDNSKALSTEIFVMLLDLNDVYLSLTLQYIQVGLQIQYIFYNF